jgi:hypothetical protein
MRRVGEKGSGVRTYLHVLIGVSCTLKLRHLFVQAGYTATTVLLLLLDDLEGCADAARSHR